MRQKLVESVLVVIQTGHGHQETLNDFPGLSPVVGLRVGTLQTVESRLYGLEKKYTRQIFILYSLYS